MIYTISHGKFEIHRDVLYMEQNLQLLHFYMEQVWIQ